MVRFSVFTLFLLFFQVSQALRVIPMQEAVNLILDNSRNVQEAQLFIQQQQQLVKGSFSIPNLKVFLESPTGTFYTPSFLQSFDFLTVYAQQRHLLDQEATLGAKVAQETSYDIKYQVRLLYLAMQYTDSSLRLLRDQDSLYYNLARFTKRQFDTGQIDYLQTVYAEAQAGEIRNIFLQTEAWRNAYRSQNEKGYLHMHPGVEDGKYGLHTTIEKPGTYRGWIQFNADSKMHTIDFTWNVAKGTGTSAAKADGHSSHSH